MAVASAGPYASLHLAPDRQPRQHPTTQPDVVLGGAKPPISSQGRGGQGRGQKGRSQRPKWSIAGMWFLGTGKLASSYLPARVSVGELQAPLAGSRAESRPLKGFLYSRGARRPLLELAGGQVSGGGHGQLVPTPLNQPMAMQLNTNSVATVAWRRQRRRGGVDGFHASTVF